MPDFTLVRLGNIFLDFMLKELNEYSCIIALSVPNFVKFAVFGPPEAPWCTESDSCAIWQRRMHHRCSVHISRTQWRNVCMEASKILNICDV